MSSKLNKHRVTAEDDDMDMGDEAQDEDSVVDVDPRWDSLRDLNFGGAEY
jgi:hypothetical protein